MFKGWKLPKIPGFNLKLPLNTGEFPPLNYVDE